MICLTISVLLGTASFDSECLAAQTTEDAAANWHHWRGPDVTGVSSTAKPPTQWSENENIQWKVPIDGAGTSTPIVWGDKVFLLTAIKTEEKDESIPDPKDQPKQNYFDIKRPNAFHQFVVICLDRTTGQENWRQVANKLVPHEGHHGDCDFAPASPTTDGERIYCWFGSAGLFCYDLDGNPVWQRDLGKMYVGSSVGEGCSPVIHDGKLIVVRDHTRQSMIHVLDAQSGDTIWEKKRDESDAWATPCVVEHNGATQVITAASNQVRSYNLDDGEVIWSCRGLTGNVIPCPIVDGDLVYCMSGYKGFSILAMRITASGDITETENVAWKQRKGAPYIPSPLLFDRTLYFVQSNTNILSAIDSQTGESIRKRDRLPQLKNIFASPVAADGRLYFVDRSGKTLVMDAANNLEVVSVNSLNERIDASPALAGNQLFLRGEKSLYCISAE